MSLNEKLNAAKTAFLSIPSSLESLPDAVKTKVREAFPWLRIGSYAQEFESRSDWRKNLHGFIAGVDCLIVAYDSTRLITGGVLREIRSAQRSKKPIVLFNVDDNSFRPFCGLVVVKQETKTLVRLLRRSEVKRSEPRVVEGQRLIGRKSWERPTAGGSVPGPAGIGSSASSGCSQA